MEVLVDGVKHYRDGPTGAVMARGWTQEWLSLTECNQVNTISGEKRTRTEWIANHEYVDDNAQDAQMEAAAGVGPLERSSSPMTGLGVRRDGPVGRMMQAGWRHIFLEGTKYYKNDITNEILSIDEWNAAPKYDGLEPIAIPRFHDDEDEGQPDEEAAESPSEHESEASPSASEASPEASPASAASPAVPAPVSDTPQVPLSIARRLRTQRKLANVKPTDIRRIMRRGGVVRSSKEAAHEAIGALRDFLKTTLHNAACQTESRNSKTVTVQDIVQGLKRITNERFNQQAATN